MTSSQSQTAIVQVPSTLSPGHTLPLAVSHSAAMPELPSPYHVLVRVLAVALNPTDHKMVTHFPSPGSMVGCDFCGVVEKDFDSGSVSDADSDGIRVVYLAGTRVCGGVFPYGRQQNLCSGAFAQWVVADARLLLRVPDGWDDSEGAALGGIGWGTVALALSDPSALALPALPSKPMAEKEPVLVYGGATATGTMACQLLKLSGYSPVAVTSTISAPLAIEYGAVGAAPYSSPRCVEIIRELADGVSIHHALDCITSPESVAHCFAAMARAGGRYACLEGLDEAWRTRRAISVKEVMGFEGLGVPVELGPRAPTYSRGANPELFDICVRWASEMQRLLDKGLLKPHPVQEVTGQWDGIIDGLAMLQRGEVRGHKVVIKV